MRIVRTRILNEDRYLGEILLGQSFRLLSSATPENLSKAGFNEGAPVGATLLPSIVGRTTRFNAEGRWITRRDQPKERRYIGSRIFQRMEWHGDQQVPRESVVDFHRMCYPRELVAPPALELTIVEVNGRQFLCTPPVEKRNDGGADARHVINLMLELFRETDIVREDLAPLIMPELESANWTFLPPGEHPFDRVAEHIARVVARKPLVARFASERQEFIVGLGPDHIFKGEGGFSDYFAYLFEDRGLTVLESIAIGNAIYVLDQNWQVASRLTKAQILDQNLHKERVVHSEGWRVRLVAALDG